MRQGAAYVDSGASATDAVDGTVTVTTSGTVDVNTAGTYTLTYSASDATGNVATSVTRTVTVVDTTAPVITLTGLASVTHELGTTYADAGATSNGGDTVTTSGTVDVNTAGTYTLTYSASDAAGNAATSVSRTVVVEKTTVLQTLSLKAGWNLVSFYVESEGMTPSAVLASIKGNLLQIKNLKSSYDPVLPPFLNTLKGLNVKDGYWVSMDADVSFELEGVVPAGASITVKPGWNLVGYPRGSGASPANELTSLGNIRCSSSRT